MAYTKKIREQITSVIDNYDAFLKSNKWRIYRSGILMIYSNKCWYCSSQKNLCVHHIQYNRRNLLINGNGNLRRLKNVVVVCEKCHNAIHTIQKTEKVVISKATSLFSQRNYPDKRRNMGRKEIRERYDKLFPY